MQFQTAVASLGVVPVPIDFIRSGTSRILVFRGCKSKTEATRIIRAILLGEGRSEGFGGTHYQLNKAAEVWPTDNESIAFRFYQMQADTREIVIGLECANSAAAAAWVALNTKMIATRNENVAATNIETGQTMAIRFSKIGLAQVRFYYNDNGTAAHILRLDDAVCHVVRRGNLFGFSELPWPMPTDEAIVEYYGRLEAALTKSNDDWYDALKLVAFARSPGNTSVIEARCVYRSQLHHSIPGSAAMALADFLGNGAQLVGTARYRFHNKDISNSVWLGKEPRGIRFAEFETSIRPLLSGTAYVACA